MKGIVPMDRKALIRNRHRAQLGMGGHSSRALQADWVEHGAGSVVFEILDTLAPPDQPDYDPSDDVATT